MIDLDAATLTKWTTVIATEALQAAEKHRSKSTSSCFQQMLTGLHVIQQSIDQRQYVKRRREM